MLYVHASALDNLHLFLWIEDGRALARNRRRGSGGGRHPFALDEAVAAPLARLLGLPEEAIFPITQATLYLPCHQHTPLPSPGLANALVGPPTEGDPDPIHGSGPSLPLNAHANAALHLNSASSSADAPGTATSLLEPEDAGSRAPGQEEHVRAIAVPLPVTQSAHLTLDLPETPQPATSPARSARTDLLPWTVFGWSLRPSEAALLLAHLPTSLGEGMQAGPDLELWSAVARWTLTLLRRGHLVPGLRLETRRHDDDPSHPQAGWIPTLDTPSDTAILERLCSAFPPAASCHARETPPPRTILTRFVTLAVAELARHWIRRSDLSLAIPSHWPPDVRVWLTTLSRGEESVEIEGGRALAADLARWLGVLAPPPARPDFRTGFRLEPPPPDIQPQDPSEADTVPENPQHEEEAAWSVRVFLQAVDDPAVEATAQEVWAAGGSVLEKGGHRLPNPQEKLLGDLGRALRLFPALERMLGASTGFDEVDACPITLAEACQFIRSTAWLLSESGFAVSLPPFVTDPAAAPRLNLRALAKASPLISAHGENARATASSGASRATDLSPSGWLDDDSDSASQFGLQSLLDYEWRVSIGADTVDPRDFMQLVARKVPLIYLRDRWVHVDPTPAEAMCATWQEHADGPLSLKDAIVLAAGSEPALKLTLDGDLAALDDPGKVPPVPPPVGLRATLRPYQFQGYAWLVDRVRRGIGACLADDMGLGKTVQVIALLLADRERHLPEPPAFDAPDGACGQTGSGLQSRRPWLIVCPTSLIGNWKREVARFAPSLEVLVHHGRTRTASAVPQFEASPDNRFAGADLVLTSYGLVARDPRLALQSWRGVILDEAQHVKNADATGARAVRALGSQVRIAMTGTPIENRLADLWSLMEFLNPGLLGTSQSFQRRFAIPIERYGNESRRDSLRRAITPFLLRRKKTDPSILKDLPEKQENKVYCPLTREQAALYEACVRERLERIEASDGIQRRGVVLSTMLRLKQICNHPSHFLDDSAPLDGRSGKLACLVELLEKVLAGGERALVFTQFRTWAIRLSTWLARTLSVDVACLHGETPREQRDRLVERFASEDGPPIFVLAVKAGGVGLNLTQANHVFHFDRWWNPAVENQATDRAFRIGQRRDVQVHKLICLGTLEEAIDRLLESKIGLAESVVGGGESWLTELTTGELREMLTLRDTVVEDNEE